MLAQRSFPSGRVVPAAILCATVVLWTLSASAQTRAIDPAKSTMTVRVYKSGVFSAFGHDHEIAAPIARGSVDEKARRVELRVNSAALKVQDPNASEKDRAEIQKTMQTEVLEAERYPEIAFHSTAVDPAGEGAWTVHGELTLHGQTRPVAVQVRESNGRFTGSARVKQSDFGIQPVKVAGGTVKVKDEVRIEFDLNLQR